MIVGIDGPPLASGPGGTPRANHPRRGQRYRVQGSPVAGCARWYVDSSDRRFLEFSHYAKGPAVRRRIGCRGQRALRRATIACSSRLAGVAQLVEQLIRNQQVLGSSPSAGSNRINHLQPMLPQAFYP